MMCELRSNHRPAANYRPTVSVIIPAYNARATIGETIHSVLQQTWRDLEVVVINDGSTDDTLAQISTIQDPRLRVFSSENQGHSVARNLGLQQARGEFISFIDADDLWTPDKLEKQLIALQNYPQAGVAHSWVQCIDHQGQFLYNCVPINLAGNVWEAMLLSNFLITGSNILVRRSTIEAVGDFNTTLSKSEDWEYFLRLAKQTEFALVPEYQILYRKTLGSASLKVEEMEQCSLSILNTALQDAQPKFHKIHRRSIANIYRYSAESYLRERASQTDLLKALNRLIRSFWTSPSILLEPTSQRLCKRWLLRSYQLLF